MPRLLIISYDAVGDDLFERLLQYPNFARLAGRSAVYRGVSSVFPTNTYPVHTSVVTGAEPRAHGVTGNTREFPGREAVWNADAALIRVPTVWQEAAARGVEVAAVLWPVTAGTRAIRWHIPEVMAPRGKNQILTSLAAGSKWLQLKEFLRHGKLLRGVDQPYLDRFSTACMIDILREHSPGLALIHFTAYDTLCHRHGLGAPELDAAFDALDEHLGRLLDAAGEECAVILFSDHAQLPVAHHIQPNRLLEAQGYLAMGADGEYVDEGRFVECCGGCAFLHWRGAPDALPTLREAFARMDGFGRFLTPEEMACAGKSALPFGFAAAPGYAFSPHEGYEKATHGYPVDYDNYKVFYLVRSEHDAAGAAGAGGSLLDLAPIARRILGPEGKGTI